MRKMANQAKKNMNIEIIKNTFFVSLARNLMSLENSGTSQGTIYKFSGQAFRLINDISGKLLCLFLRG